MMGRNQSVLLALVFAAVAHALVVRPTSRQEQAIPQVTPEAEPNAFERDAKLLQSALRLQERIAANGCDARLCVAFDGSASLGADAFVAAKEFVQVLAVIADTDQRASYAALQFGLTNSLVSSPTTNATDFVQKVAVAPFANATATFTSAGVFGCARILARNDTTSTPEATGGRAVVVVIGDGKDNFGVRPAAITDSFLDEEPAGDVLAVAVGDADQEALARVASNGTAVLDITDPALIANATVSAVEFICQLPKE